MKHDCCTDKCHN